MLFEERTYEFGRHGIRSIAKGIEKPIAASSTIILVGEKLRVTSLGESALTWVKTIDFRGTEPNDISIATFTSEYYDCSNGGGQTVQRRRKENGYFRTKTVCTADTASSENKDSLRC